MLTMLPRCGAGSSLTNDDFGRLAPMLLTQEGETVITPERIQNSQKLLWILFRMVHLSTALPEEQQGRLGPLVERYRGLETKHVLEEVDGARWNHTRTPQIIRQYTTSKQRLRPTWFASLASLASDVTVVACNTSQLINANFTAHELAKHTT